MEKTFCRISNWSRLPSYNGSWIKAHHQNMSVNASYEHCHVSDILTPIFKYNGDILNSNNYRGISITATISKINETILKFRIKPYILDVQNLLQRGFTENTVPPISSILLEEYEMENTDLNKPTVFGILDATSACDVIWHSHLIRKLCHMGISKQAILMIDNLYNNAVSKINWKAQSSAPFPINQGDRQCGTVSTDLCKVYMN